MLSRNYRLAASRDIQRVQKNGKTLNTPFFRVKTAPNHLGQFRCAIIIPNKIAKTIVARNRKRRQIAAVMRELKPLLNASADIIVAPTAQAMNKDFATLRDDLIAAFTKIRFLDATRTK